MIAHENRKGFWTSDAHKLARLLAKHPNIEVVVDFNVWKSYQEHTSDRETNTRVKGMVKKADVVLRFIPPTQGDERHDGPRLEVNKARYAGKPIGEILIGGARQSPDNSLKGSSSEKYYQYNLQKGEPRLAGVHKVLKHFSDNGVLPDNIKIE